MSTQPSHKPQNPCFSSGPCAKRPGWSVEALSDALTGRSHRSKPGKDKLKGVIEQHRALLGIPEDYLIGIVPASDTGAVEIALWSMLGPRGVDVLAWESFSGDWLKDIVEQLKLPGVREFKADYGQLPDLSEISPARDVVFCWNGTTSGVCVPHADWLSEDRKGLTICDATSAVFAYDLPWDKLDVTTWSWQKVLGGEAAHGMLVLSPRAVERLESFVPDRPLPKIFRLTKGGRINSAIFEGATINTPSMLAVEDCLDALNWVSSIGGITATMKRSQDNLKTITQWIESSQRFAFLAEDASYRSRTSICIKIIAPEFLVLSEDDQRATIKSIVGLLDNEGIAYDIASYRDAPAGLRIWGGATVETSDIQALLPWIDWAYEQIML